MEEERKEGRKEGRREGGREGGGSKEGIFMFPQFRISVSMILLRVFSAEVLSSTLYCV